MRNFSVAELEAQAKEFFDTTHWSDGKGNLDMPVDWHGNECAAYDPELDEEDEGVTQDAVCGMSVTQDIEQREDVSLKEGVTRYGSVKFADPINKKYPLDTEAHVRAAASYFGMAKNRALYKEDEQKTIQGRIDAAKKKFKIGSK